MEIGSGEAVPVEMTGRWRLGMRRRPAAEASLVALFSQVVCEQDGVEVRREKGGGLPEMQEHEEEGRTQHTCGGDGVDGGEGDHRRRRRPPSVALPRLPLSPRSFFREVKRYDGEGRARFRGKRRRGALNCGRAGGSVRECPRYSFAIPSANAELFQTAVLGAG